MNDTRIEKALIKGESNKDNLMEVAEYLGNKYNTSIEPGKQFTKEQLNEVVDMMAMNMATAVEIKKNGYILIGALVGVVGTIIILKIKKKFKKDEA